jgi:acetyl esterase/lipase
MTWLRLALGTFVVALACAWPRGAPSIAEEDPVLVHRDVVFGCTGGRDLRLDLYRPRTSSAPTPAVLLFHGGGWSGGRKEQMRGLARFLAAEGYAALAVGYRLAPQCPWPAQVEDAKCAVRWLRAHATEHGVDASRIGALGFSAGGHLALLLGTMDPDDGCEGDGGCPEAGSKVSVVVSFFGPTDMETLADGEEPNELRRALGVAALGVLLGAEFREDPSRMSPVRYVSPGDAPTLLFHGTRDPLVPAHQASRFLDALTQAGVPGKAVLIAGAGHGWRDPELADSIEATLRWLDRHLRPGQVRSRTREIFTR